MIEAILFLAGMLVGLALAAVVAWAASDSDPSTTSSGAAR